MVDNPGESPAGSKSDFEVSDKQIRNLLDIGKIAEVKMFQTLLAKVRDGDILSVGENRTFNLLKQELKAKIDGGDAAAGVLPDAGEKFLKYGDAAKYCGYSTRTLSYHVRRKNIEQRPDGTFSTKVLDAFLMKSGFKGVTENGEDISAVKEKTGVAIQQLKLKREDYLFKQLEESLMSRHEVEEEWAGRVAELKFGLDNWANALPPTLEGKDKAQIKLAITAEVHALFDRFSRAGRWTPAVKRTLKKKLNGALPSVP